MGAPQSSPHPGPQQPYPSLNMNSEPQNSNIILVGEHSKHVETDVYNNRVVEKHELYFTLECKVECTNKTGKKVTLPKLKSSQKMNGLFNKIIVYPDPRVQNKFFIQFFLPDSSF